MTETALHRQFARLRLAYAGSGLSRFLDWWLAELAPLVPPRVRAWFAEPHVEVLVRIDGDELVLHRDDLAEGERRFLLTQDAELVRNEIGTELALITRPLRVVLALPSTRILRRTVTLPGAAEENLRQVLAFEMDRQTPFKADQVYFDFRVLRRDAVTKQIDVDLVLVPRTVVDPVLARLEPTGLALDGVDALDATGARLGVNLLPAERRAARKNVWLRLNLALGAVALLLAAIVMGQSTANREEALEQLRAATEEGREEARSVSALRRSLKDAIEGANFLFEKKTKHPVFVDLLLDVTRRLPDDTWLMRFSLSTDGTVSIQGQATEAAKLISLLQQSPVLESPAFQGAISPDARTNKQSFLISAKAKSRDAAKKANGKAADVKGGRTRGAKAKADAEGGETRAPKPEKTDGE